MGTAELAPLLVRTFKNTVENLLGEYMCREGPNRLL